MLHCEKMESCTPTIPPVRWVIAACQCYNLFALHYTKFKAISPPEFQ